MASSRIFIKGLPPSITEADFKKHFAFKGKEVTDARLFANRRIGYVGYKTPEDAKAAVRYFNKTFVRMSRIGVEIARTVDEAKKDKEARGGRAPTAQRDSAFTGANSVEKKARPEEKTEEEQDPKLIEFLEVMKPKSKKRAWENENETNNAQQGKLDDEIEMRTELQGASDDEYEEVPRHAKRAKLEPSPRAEAAVAGTQTAAESSHDEPADDITSIEEPGEDALQADAGLQAPVSDADWARSRTSRLLGLLDDDEEEAETARPRNQAMKDASEDEDEDEAQVPSRPMAQSAPEPAKSIPTPPADDEVVAEDEKPVLEMNATGVRSSMRLFLRNLPFDVEQSALEAEFSSFGHVEEVRLTTNFLFFNTTLAKMNT